jgi:hypothetical protein
MRPGVAERDPSWERLSPFLPTYTPPRIPQTPGKTRLAGRDQRKKMSPGRPTDYSAETVTQAEGR